MPAATANRAPLRKTFTSHPASRLFLDLNHGNFKPPAGAAGRSNNAGIRGMWLTLCPFSPNPQGVGEPSGGRGAGHASIPKESW